MQKTNNFLLLTLILTLLVACESSDNAKNINDKSSSILPKFISINNKGVGEMGSFDYDKATNTFESLVQQNSEWVLAKQNYAIALLNRQKAGDEDKAIEISNQLIANDANNTVAHYILGILKFNQGLCEQALTHFDTVIEIDPTDAHALYFSGQCHLQNGQIQDALDLYQKAINANNYLRSAYYGSFMAAQRLEKPEVAEDMLNAYQKLASNPKAQLAEIKYTRMGPKVMAQAYNLSQETKTHKILQGPYFKQPILLNISTNSTTIENFGIVDLQQSGNPYLYVISNNTLSLFEQKTNQFQEINRLETQLPKGVNKLAWGDINNDNLIDFYATGETDQLFYQSENGFNSVEIESLKLHSKAVRIADTDHDGDLDILVLSQKGQFKLLNNNLDGTFKDLTDELQVSDNLNFSSLYIQDIDKDRDADIILIKESSLITLINNRMWDYQILSQKFDSPILSLTFSDNNLNGIPEVNVLSKESINSLEFDEANYTSQHQLKTNLASKLLQYDINGSGISEYLLFTNNAIEIFDHKGHKLEQLSISNKDKTKVIQSIDGPELMTLKDSKLYYYQAQNRTPFLFFSLSGKEDEANSVRSNYSGIGTTLTLHNQGFYATADSFQNHSGTDQDYQGISIAAGPNQNIDYLAMEWSDGVYQTELNLDSSVYHSIQETQRQLSSCPVIFAWNNGEYEFISDVLGVGGIGFAIGKDVYGTPRPWENYLLNQDQLSSENGVFKFQFTEPMEESAYLDEFQIDVIDVDKNWSVILDERMVINPPNATGEAIFYQEEIKPISAITLSGNDVTTEILMTDKIAASLENKDHRFLGLIDEQVITLEFDQKLQGNYNLIMNGWVEYGYSQTMFAAWQAGLNAQAPTIEAMVDGQWQVILKEFGYPAGMPRMASVPISIPQETEFLRIKTNMEIYFDKLSLIKPEKFVKVARYSIPMNSARLHQLGYPLRSDNEQRVPEYDFQHIKPFWDTRYMQGAYTQIGDITPLVEKNDNALAIIGAGEAIEFEFIDNLPPLSEDHNRYYILKFKGWAKDMDILTKDGETLAPIPNNGNLNEHAKQLNAKYNTRFKAGK